VRKHLRIVIENTGGGVAEECEAKLRLITDNHDGTNPSMEPKILQWSSSNIVKETIGIGSYSVLNVVFSIDRNIHNNKFAYVCTAMSLNGPRLPRIVDGFNIGLYDFEIVVRALDGTFIRQVFQVKVTNNWLELSMHKIP
jgi:hypothetical protein